MTQELPLSSAELIFVNYALKDRILKLESFLTADIEQTYKVELAALKRAIKINKRIIKHGRA